MSINVESLLSTILENVMGKVGSLVLEEVCLAWDLVRDLKKLGENLLTIKAVLLDAEEKQVQANELKVWLERLKKFCYEAEDVLDELEYEGLRKQVVKQYGSTKTKVCRFFSSSNPLVFRFKIGHKIKELRESLDDIVAQKSKFHLAELVRPIMEHRVREMTDSVLHLSKVVGREFDMYTITRLLLRDGSLGVIPIVGMGGLGKTVLAKMLYSNETIHEHFELKIWVCVSEDGFDKKKIMVKMMNFFSREKLSDSDYDPEQMRISIRDKLNGKRFLLVLDDVWSDNRREWLELVDLLEEGGSGSKVIVTTRSNNVAKIIGTTPPYNLQPLCDEDCFSLFKKLAFRKEEEECYPNLVEIGKDIVKKCRGFPLAIRTLGTLLYTKRDEQEWVFIADNEMWKLEQSRGDILPVLKLSYDQLPSHLKSCFAICSAFPEDFEFDSLQLTRIWMAHGLLQSPYRNEELEDIGLRYVKELCSRSFFQDIEEFDFAWRFKMHDLMRNLAIFVAHNECLGLKQHYRNISRGTRHLSLLDVKDFLDIEVPTNSLQTINLVPYGEESPSVIKSLVDTCRRLRVLLIVDGSFDVLPSSIGDLKHLSYLQLGLNGIEKLPDSLWKLHNLQTLDIIGCVQLKELPRDIRKLIKLRVLRFTTKQKRLPKNGLSHLKSLRDLIVWKCAQLEVLFEGKPHTTFLRSLIISSCTSLISLGLSLKCLAALETLIITNCARLNLMKEDDNRDIEFRLRYLLLGGLPQLMTLPMWLQRSSKTLQCLHVAFCENLSFLPEWLLNFKSLKKFEIKYCPKLLTLPEGFHQLTSLRWLVIEGCPALTERCKREGEDWLKISHIPNIIIT